MNQNEKLEPEGPGVPTHKERAERVYDALQEKLGKAPMGTQNFYFSKVEIEGLMGLLSHRFEGIW